MTKRPPSPLALSRQRAEAVRFRDALARRGIQLCVRNGIVKWTASGEETLTAGEQWAIYQQVMTLKALIEEEGPS